LFLRLLFLHATTPKTFHLSSATEHGLKIRRGSLQRRWEADGNLPTDTCKFATTDRQWVLEISMLPLNSPKMGIFSPKFCIIGRKCPEK